VNSDNSFLPPEGLSAWDKAALRNFRFLMGRGKIGKGGSKRIEQSLKLNGVVIRLYRIFSPFPRSIKVFVLFGSGFPA
jgi:hypothetical protein